MRTSHQLYEKLAPELYKDLPVLRLSDLTYGNVEFQEKARLKVYLQTAAKEHTGAALALISEHYERIMHLALVKAAPMSGTCLGYLPVLSDAYRYSLCT